MITDVEKDEIVEFFEKYGRYWMRSVFIRVIDENQEAAKMIQKLLNENENQKATYQETKAMEWLKKWGHA